MWIRNPSAFGVSLFQIPLIAAGLRSARARVQAVSVILEVSYHALHIICTTSAAVPMKFNFARSSTGTGIQPPVDTNFALVAAAVAARSKFI